VKASIFPWQGIAPRIAPSAWIAPNATIIGDVTIGEGSSIWFNVTVRGDVHHIRIGARTNIQDGSVVHVTRGKYSTTVGDDILIGHMALIHGCVLESGCFIGMKACVMDNVVVESGAMVAAGALVTPGKRVRSGELWGGSPAKLLRPLTDAEREEIRNVPQRYAALAMQYKKDGIG
jgi:carbonic anhydrase/acetyltransferase-like protein (isoleucine patch superfamily)